MYNLKAMKEAAQIMCHFLLQVWVFFVTLILDGCIYTSELTISYILSKFDSIFRKRRTVSGIHEERLCSNIRQASSTVAGSLLQK